MLTREQVLDAIKTHTWESQTITGRDLQRLVDFFPTSDWETIGCQLREGATPPALREWSEGEIKTQLADDVAFAFEKALGKRGISASEMCQVVQMWMWILGDTELATSKNYAQYGLPILKAVALKYGLPNGIGDDVGDERKYAG